MEQSEQASKERKQAMKKLREERAKTIAEAVNRMKEQKHAVKLIKKQLSDGGKTVPEVAEITGMGSPDVLWYVTAMKKYGEIVEGAKDDGYFIYSLSDSGAVEKQSE
jgi:hypothetical protein